MVSVCPAIVIVVEREAVPVFAVTLKLTSLVPTPVPCATSIHGTDFDADQLHPAGAVTVNRPPPPAAGMLCEAGLIVNVHATAVWRIVTVWPATVLVPLR